MMNNKLLSICIPTYNRAEKLRISLLEILKQANLYQNEVEVIVSNNASTDNTNDVLKQLKIEFPFMIVFQNEDNLGFNRNIFLLSDKYASGKYLWLIGDDDIVDLGSIQRLLFLIRENPDVPFISLNFRLLPPSDIGKTKHEVKSISEKRLKMSNLINIQCRPENLLLTFMSCNVIQLSLFKEFDKTIFSFDSWTNYKSLFPHAHIIASVIKPSEEVLFMEDPILSAMLHIKEKEWDDKGPLINIFYIIDVYKYLLKVGHKKEDLEYAKLIIINSGIGPLFNMRLKMKYKINFLRFVLLEFGFYKGVIKKIASRF